MFLKNCRRCAAEVDSAQGVEDLAEGDLVEAVGVDLEVEAVLEVGVALVVEQGGDLGMEISLVGGEAEEDSNSSI